ncbi:hypothetical protein Lesp02_11800 [Lentzea sp. NBRC 105346]|uniref:type VII secretion protein EccCb n=1 Tax=Lentzea sp. NBRC 105346 TaxID=3032205 RepID=UPI0024A24926|nr:type VII secretion protein EccCb [Lentzea sp. NBRC 105346]GLZ28990.1 hypothetical protein Lesp02_11800 [Lentzea sp. NBRC 105346]
MAKTNLFGLLGIDPAGFDVQQMWASLPPARRSKVPIGATASGVPVVLDLDGTHLYVRGGHRSGKSELLRAAALGLMLTHSPADLNVVFVDGTPDRTFADLAQAPHVLASVERATPSDDTRLQQALRGELNRRSGSAEPLTDLVLVVDALESVSPEWFDVLWNLAWYGRKHGIHLLASGDSDAPQWLERVAVLSAPGAALLDGTEFGPCFVSQPAEGGTLLQLAAAQLTGKGTPALDFVKPPLTELALSAITAAAPPLTVPIGLIDNPELGRYTGLLVDLSALDGHVVVVGAHGSGKSTLLKTFITSLALNHTPAQVQVYGLDFTGGALTTLLDVPHCRAMVSSSDPTMVWHVTRSIGDLISRREQALRGAGVHTIADYRAHVAEQGMVNNEPADVVVVVDGWPGAALQEWLRYYLVDFVSRGADFGIHVVLTASRWSELAPEFYGAFGTRLELTLTDPATSVVDTTVRHPGPGHGIDGSSRRFLIALADVDVPAVDDAPPKMRPLPDEVLRTSLSTTGYRIPLGITEGDHQTVFASDTRHLLVYGDEGSGRSAALRTYLKGIIGTHEAAQALFILVDPRKSNMSGEWGDHLLQYAPSANALKDPMSDVVASLRKRVGNEWSGPNLYVVVDDYDLLAAYDNPLQPLAEFFPSARQIGLHVVIASRHHHIKQDSFLAAFPPDETSVLMLSGTSGTAEAMSGLMPTPMPPGRGVLSSPAGQRTIQVAWSPAG